MTLSSNGAGTLERLVIGTVNHRRAIARTDEVEFDN